MTRSAFTMLSSTDPAQTDEPGRIWMSLTRLKTARISGSSRFLAVTLGGRRWLKAFIGRTDWTKVLA
jgi:hypothetical protein